jgi:hypothetical protein
LAHRRLTLHICRSLGHLAGSLPTNPLREGFVPVMKLLQDAEWSPSEVRAEVERRTAAGEILSAADVKPVQTGA